MKTNKSTADNRTSLSSEKMSSAVERLLMFIFSRIIVLPIVLVLARTDAFIIGTSKESISNLFVSQVSLHQKAISQGDSRAIQLPANHTPNPVYTYFAEKLDKREEATYLLVIIESADNPLCTLNAECGLSDAVQYLSSKTKKQATYSYRKKPKGHNTLASEFAYLCSGLGMELCLPRIASRIGMPTRYYHLNDLNFYGRRKIMEDVGFKELISMEEEENKKSPFMGALRCLRRQFCAPKDTFMFDSFMDTISNNQKTSFNSLLTIDLHPPYGGSSPAEGYSTTRRESLSHVGKFVDKIVDYHAVANRKLFMVIAADHAPSNLKESKLDFPQGFWIIEVNANASAI